MRAVNRFMLSMLAVIALAGCASSAPSGGSADQEASTSEVSEEAPGITEEPTDDSSSEAASEPPSEAALRMVVWDDSSNGAAEDFEVWIQGTGSWFPAQTELLEEAGPFPVGSESTFFIYPEGRDGVEIEVMLEVPSDVIEGSVKDMVQIEVGDSSLVVFGTSVPDFEVAFDF